MASREVRKCEGRNFQQRLADESVIREDILEDLASFANFRPQVRVERGTSREVGFWRVHQAEQGGKVCPFGISNCEFDTCTPDSLHCGGVTGGES